MDSDNIEEPVFQNMPDPTDEQLVLPEFAIIWQVIKTWDINVPECYEGYCGANGSHVAMILNALSQVCDHDWRVNPHMQLLTNPPRQMLVCANCGDRRSRISPGGFNLYSDNPTDWPKA